MVSIRLHNALSRQKNAFIPADPQRVTMYVCGPTVYNYVHFGNARPVVVFDVLYRLFSGHHPQVTPPAVVVAALNQPVISLSGPSKPRGLLACFGNPQGALPPTVLLDAQRTGEIDEAWLRTVLNRCTNHQGVT